jgi:hypothetical protein
MVAGDVEQVGLDALRAAASLVDLDAKAGCFLCLAIAKLVEQR